MKCREIQQFISDILHKLTVILFESVVAIAGVAAYNNHKLKKEASKGSSDESPHPESIRLTESSTSNS